MTCETCGEKPKNTAKDFTKTVIEINNPERLVLLRKVVIPASMGTEEQVPAAIGKYHNVILYYEANKHIYLYSSDGIPTLLEIDIPQEMWDRIETLEEGLDDEEEIRSTEDTRLQQEIDDLKNSPDVVDIVATYADLQAYDTSELGDKDVIRVLADETHDGESSYYRWSTTTQTWTFIGATGPYYTKDETDALLDDKQDTLTAGEGINITSDIIKATNTGKAKVLTSADYNWNSSTNDATQPYNCIAIWRLESGIYTAENNTVKVYYNKTKHNSMAGTTAIVMRAVPNGETTVLFVYGSQRPQVTCVLSDDSTHVPANSLMMIGQDIYQSEGLATNAVMSQKATTDMVFSDSAKTRVRIGINARTAPVGSTTNYEKAIAIGSYAHALGDYTLVIGGGNDYLDHASANSDYGVALGHNATVNEDSGVALGRTGRAQGKGSVSIGAYSEASSQGEFNIGASNTDYGYNDTNYRLITGVHDPQGANDAATKGYVDGNVGRIRMLTTADYNWNSTTHTTDNPDCVAIWLLPSGAYYVDNENAVYYCQTASIGRQSQANTMFFVSAPTNVQRGMIVELSNTQTFCKIYSGITNAGVPATTLPLSTFIVDNLTNPANDAALSAAQGVYLKGMIGDLAALATTDKTSTVAAINEIKTSVPNIVQSTGTSTDYVMSQDAASKMVYADPATKVRIAIGSGAEAETDNSIAIGRNSSAKSNGAVAIGDNDTRAWENSVNIGAGAGNYNSNGARRQVSIGYLAGLNNSLAPDSISIGSYSKATAAGEMNVGTPSDTTKGYNGTEYRLITGVYDPQNAHDAATKGYVDSVVPTITMQTTDPGEGQPLAANHFIGVYQ